MKNDILDKIKDCKSAEEVKALFDEKRELSLDELEQISGGGMRVMGIDVHNKEDISRICDILKMVEGKFDRKDVLSIVDSILPDRFGVEEYLKDGVPGVYRKLYAKLAEHI